MSTLLLAPHNDDEGLFASFIIQRLKPLTVLVITDGAIHEKRFGVERGIVARRKETEEACKLLGVSQMSLRIPDDELTEEGLEIKFLELGLTSSDNRYSRVLAPSIQGGHEHHDTVSRVAQRLLGERVLYYSTYAKGDLTMRGELEVKPTEAERELKEKVLACYKSQHAINAPHFEAVKNASEYLNLKPC